MRRTWKQGLPGSFVWTHGRASGAFILGLWDFGHRPRDQRHCGRASVRCDRLYHALQGRSGTHLRDCRFQGGNTHKQAPDCSRPGHESRLVSQPPSKAAGRNEGRAWVEAYMCPPASVTPRSMGPGEVMAGLDMVEPSCRFPSCRSAGLERRRRAIRPIVHRCHDARLDERAPIGSGGYQAPLVLESSVHVRLYGGRDDTSWAV
jgi:hypothetical protein